MMNPDTNFRMLGESHAFLEVQEQVSRVAPLDKPVLVVGERGTGKELIAARLHYLSERWGQPYLKINCAAFSESLLDSELFGHEQGAFSGATRQHKGVFERADGGTLFLDELATASMQVQEKILRVIEYGELNRLGGDKILQVDVRLVAATNGDLPRLAAAEKFRSDLLDRLAFDVITLPPLRARPGDIMVLAEFFAVEMAKELNLEFFPGFAPSAELALRKHSWLGNVRELKNVVQRAVYRNPEPTAPIEDIVFDPFDSPYRPRIENVAALEDVAQAMTSGDKHNDEALGHTGRSAQSVHQEENLTTDFKQQVRDFEIRLLRQAYKNCHFNQRKTAEMLGLSYDQFRGYLRKYKINPEDL